ncbi:hypothetical protein PoB_002046000 [Plakobranchus ocellatus]|uniref:Uncharacterized protein n=1 Tax=Plakobranchus ocellatus TaxID=259542 RepID=A0AAV3ZHA1_9GAST|nr:hypothetical protein PoB_002046000 [Plakobranchus ocellatus]
MRQSDYAPTSDLTQRQMAHGQTALPGDSKPKIHRTGVINVLSRQVGYRDWLSRAQHRLCLRSLATGVRSLHTLPYP